MTLLIFLEAGLLWHTTEVNGDDAGASLSKSTISERAYYTVAGDESQLLIRV